MFANSMSIPEETIRSDKLIRRESSAVELSTPGNDNSILTTLVPNVVANDPESLKFESVTSAKSERGRKKKKTKFASPELSKEIP